MHKDYYQYTRMTGWNLKKELAQNKIDYSIERGSVIFSEIKNECMYDAGFCTYISRPGLMYEKVDIQLVPEVKTIDKFRKKLRRCKYSISLKYFSLWFSIVAIFGLLSFSTYYLYRSWISAQKEAYVTVTGTVLAKYQTTEVSGRHGRTITPRFLMVIQTSDGVVFSEYVTPAIFAVCHESDSIALRGVDRTKVDQSYTSYVGMYGILTVLSISANLIFVVLCIFNIPVFLSKFRKLRRIDKISS